MPQRWAAKEVVAATGALGATDSAMTDRADGRGGARGSTQRRDAVGVAGRGERGHHVVAGDPPEGRAGEQVAGVVVEPADDLDLGAVGEVPVGEVGLPDLVGRGGLEPDPGAARALARLGHDWPPR